MIISDVFVYLRVICVIEVILVGWLVGWNPSVQLEVKIAR